jgi:uncharacterized protein YndB with AHSA1/START domain
VSVAASLVVPAGRAEVWRIWSDLEAWPAWNPVYLRVSLDGDLAVGTGVEMQMRHPRGRAFWTRPALTEVIPEQELSWTAKGMGLRARTVTTLEEVTSGTKLRISGETTGAMAFAYRIAMTRKVQAQLFLDTLNAFADKMRP